MRRALALLLLLSLGCTSTRRVSWEGLAAGAALADAASTQAALRSGAREINPLYGQEPATQPMLAVNASLHALVRASLRGASEAQKRATWRAVAILRFAVAVWNLSRQ